MTAGAPVLPHGLAFIEGFGPVVQYAFHAPDIESAARRWASERGAGPFYLLEHIELETSAYRGRPAPFDHSSAYGWLGEVMIELIHQHDDQPSAVRDMFDARSEGLHHAAVIVDDLETALEDAWARNMACALDATTKDGVRFVMADARSEYGVMLEFYEPTPALTKFYDFIRRKSSGWTGEDYLRRL